MQDQEQVIKLEGDVEGHSWKAYAPDDEEWLRDEIRRRGGQPTTIKLAAPADEDDTEGHAFGTVVRVNAILDDDDTEGHAISLRFPTREEADAFRRRLVATGVLTGALVIGAAGIATVANQPAGVADSGAAPAAITQVQDVDRDLGLTEAGGVAAGAVDAGTGFDSARPGDLSAAERGQAAESDRLAAMAESERVLQSGQDWEQQRQQQTPTGGSVTASLDAAYGPGGGAVGAASGSTALDALTGAGISPDQAQAMIDASAPGQLNSAALNALTGAGYSPDEAQDMLRQAHLAQSGAQWESERDQQTPSNLAGAAGSMEAAYGEGGGAVSSGTYSMDAGFSPAEAEAARDASVLESGQDWEQQRVQQSGSATQAGPMDPIEGGAYSSTQSATDAGPMDPLEAGVQPAYQAPAEAGPMDAIEGGAYSSGEGESSDEGDQGGSRFGPTPR